MKMNIDNTMNNDQMNDDDIFISPYNYCDYWCEKCIFREECLIYNTGLEANGEEEEALQVNLEEIVEYIFRLLGHNHLEKANGMIQQYLESGTNTNTYFSAAPDEEDEEEKDDDEDDDEDEDDDNDEDEDENDEDEEYDDDDEEDEDEEDEDDFIYAKICREIEEHPLQLMCFSYMEKSAEFFADYRQHYLTPSSLIDAFSNLAWYRTLLPVKMDRTLHSLFEFGVKEEHFPLEDAVLTSLVVYKSLRKSLSAVRELKNNLVDYQEILTELEELLVTIKTGLKHEFPFWIMMRILCIYLFPPHFHALDH